MPALLEGCMLVSELEDRRLRDGAGADAAPEGGSAELTATTNIETSNATPAVKEQLMKAMKANLNFAAGPDEAIKAGLGLLAGKSGTCRFNPAIYVAGGGMGYHYTSIPAIIAQAAAPLDITKPNVVIYAPERDGCLKLAAIEWVVPILVDGQLYTDTVPPTLPDEPPTIFGQPMNLRGPLSEGEDKVGFWNYQLHVWIWKANPDGIFAQWNSRVTCSFF